MPEAATTQIARDSIGVMRAVTPWGYGITYEAEWRAAFGVGDVGAAGRRIVSKGSSRGDGPKVKRGVVRRRGGKASDVNMCKHGNRSAQCSTCQAWHCACPGSPAHVCSEAG